MYTYLMLTEFNYNKTNKTTHKLDLQVITDEVDFERIITAKQHKHNDKVVQQIDKRRQELESLTNYLPKTTCPGGIRDKLWYHHHSIQDQLTSLKSGKYDVIRRNIPRGETAILEMPLGVETRKHLIAAVELTYPELLNHVYTDTELCLLFMLPLKEEDQDEYNHTL